MYIYIHFINFRSSCVCSKSSYQTSSTNYVIHLVRRGKFYTFSFFETCGKSWVKIQFKVAVQQC